MNNGQTRTINDNNAVIDADTLEGKNVWDLKQIMNTKDQKTLNKAKHYSDNGDLDVMDYADMGDSLVRDYADDGDQTTLQSAKKYARKQDKKTLVKAKTYSDAGDVITYDMGTAYADNGDANTYASATAYADANDAKGSSFNKADMQQYIYGAEYVSFLDMRYVQQFDFAEIVFRNKAYMETLKYGINHPNVEFHFEQTVNIKTARYMAEYTGMTQITGRTICKSSGACITK